MNINQNVQGRSIDWHDIDWQQCYEKVAQTQNDIVVAYNRQDMKQVNILQNQLVDSFAARAIAVRNVTSNRGKNTAGIDGQASLDPAEKVELVKSLRNHKSTSPKPVRRVWISKDGKAIKEDKSNARPLGIPSIYDRAAQSLWTLALDPIAECRGDRHSYGFRPHRSAQDAMQALYLMLATRNRPNWVLEADIKGFFDNIAHAWILDNIPMDKAVLSAWLKAGYIDRHLKYDTESGVPQGGPISPTIANMVLDGLSDHVAKAVAPHAKRGKSMKVLLVRYADDFVVTGENPEILNSVVMPAINAFLEPRGLSLNPSKTVVTNLRAGFVFLGFHFKIYPRAKHPTGFGLLIKPNKAKIQRLRERITSP
jgi:RNA-directed DNA polymerase